MMAMVPSSGLLGGSRTLQPDEAKKKAAQEVCAQRPRRKRHCQ